MAINTHMISVSGRTNEQETFTFTHLNQRTIRMAVDRAAYSLLSIHQCPPPYLSCFYFIQGLARHLTLGESTIESKPLKFSLLKKKKSSNLILLLDDVFDRSDLSKIDQYGPTIITHQVLPQRWPSCSNLARARARPPQLGSTLGILNGALAWLGSDL